MLGAVIAGNGCPKNATYTGKSCHRGVPSDCILSERRDTCGPVIARLQAVVCQLFDDAGALCRGRGEDSVGCRAQSQG